MAYFLWRLVPLKCSFLLPMASVQLCFCVFNGLLKHWSSNCNMKTAANANTQYKFYTPRHRYTPNIPWEIPCRHKHLSWRCGTGWLKLDRHKTKSIDNNDTNPPLRLAGDLSQAAWKEYLATKALRKLGAAHIRAQLWVTMLVRANLFIVLLWAWEESQQMSKNPTLAQHKFFYQRWGWNWILTIQPIFNY